MSGAAICGWRGKLLSGVGDVFAGWRDTSQYCGDHVVLNRLVLTAPLNNASRIERGIFSSLYTLLSLPLSRLRSRFLTLPYTHSFYCGFLRIGLNTKIFYQGT